MSKLIDLDTEEKTKVLINDKFLVEGAFWFEAEVTSEGEKIQYLVQGELEAKAPYIPVPIQTIGNEKYQLSGVDVYKERYGSNDDMIIYCFTAESYTIYPYDTGEGGDV